MSAAVPGGPPTGSWWHCRTLEAFPDLAGIHQIHPERYPFLLESVAHGTAQARYDILFAFPGARLVLHSGGRLLWDGASARGGNFLSHLDQVWRREALRPAGIPELPFTGGWFVYLGYELALQIEPTLAGTDRQDDLPVAFAARVPAAILRDHQTGRTHLVCEAGSEHLLGTLELDLAAAAGGVEEALPLAAVREEDPGRFLEGVGRVQEYIRAGDVFQVNLSRGWRLELGKTVEPVEVYRRLRRANPAPFAGLMRLDESRAVISSSPERLVEVRRRRVRTRPIAGTYPRSDDREEDRRWSQELLQHPKERAEHVMLIDLERNDLGRVCDAGTVKVVDFMVLESYRHVHHIVSEVTGTLGKSTTPAEVIRAVFPGGTITGCPKVRCMEIIAELEQAARGAYTGSMGYINRDGSMDFNILIRTMFQEGRRLSFRAGAGIVADSVPGRELDETRAKAKGLLAALK